MAKIVNTSQQLLKAAVYPISAYSRVISCRCLIAAPVGWRGGWTAEVGNRVWLQKVQVFLGAKAVDVSQYIEFRIITGNTPPLQWADLWAWENILPVWTGGAAIANWIVTDGTTHLSWDMSVLFKGEHRRFGILAIFGAAAGGDEIKVSFQIAEG